MSQKSNHCAPRNDISIIVLAIPNTQVLDLTYGDGKHQYQYALAGGPLAPSDTCEAPSAMSSTVYRRGWKHLLLYWVSSTLFMTERTAKWQMTSERRRCKNSAANRGGDFFFFIPLPVGFGYPEEKNRHVSWLFPSWWRTWGELAKPSESIRHPGRRSLAFPVLIKHQEGIKEDNIWWRDKSGDHGNVMQWRTLPVWSWSWPRWFFFSPSR